MKISYGITVYNEHKELDNSTQLVRDVILFDYDRKITWVPTTLDMENSKTYGQYEFLDACKKMGIVKNL